jgi:hypothetical protein
MALIQENFFVDLLYGRRFAFEHLKEIALDIQQKAGNTEALIVGAGGFKKLGEFCGAKVVGCSARVNAMHEMGDGVPLTGNVETK